MTVYVLKLKTEDRPSISEIDTVNGRALQDKYLRRIYVRGAEYGRLVDVLEHRWRAETMPHFFEAKYGDEPPVVFFALKTFQPRTRQVDVVTAYEPRVKLVRLGLVDEVMKAVVFYLVGLITDDELLEGAYRRDLPWEPPAPSIPVDPPDEEPVRMAAMYRDACYFCGEAFKDSDERAEVADKIKPTAPHRIMHAACYLEHQDRFALA